jgi:hypothetical protein
MPDIDDFDIEPAEELPRLGGGEDQRHGHGPEGGGPSFPVILGVLAVVAVAGLGGLWYAFRKPVVVQPSPVVGTPPESVAPAQTAPAPPPTPSLSLPPLDESDGLFRQWAGALSSHPALAEVLGQTALIRTIVAVVVNVVDGESPAPHLLFLKPKRSFAAVSRGGVLIPDETPFSAYVVVAEVIASLDGPKTAETFTLFEPLFDAAYRDLGHPEGGFRGALLRSMEILETTPVPRPGEHLERNGTLLRYADPRFEGLTRAQKQMLRMGPGNVRRVQGALARLRAHLEAR